MGISAALGALSPARSRSARAQLTRRGLAAHPPSRAAMSGMGRGATAHPWSRTSGCSLSGMCSGGYIIHIDDKAVTCKYHRLRMRCARSERGALAQVTSQVRVSRIISSLCVQERDLQGVKRPKGARDHELRGRMGVSAPRKSGSCARSGGKPCETASCEAKWIRRTFYPDASGDVARTGGVPPERPRGLLLHRGTARACAETTRGRTDGPPSRN